MAKYDASFDKVYEEELGRLQKPEAKKFGLDEIPAEVKEERMGQLKQKLVEYTDRLRAQWNDNQYLPLDKLSVSGRYKRDALRLVLVRGNVNTWVLAKTFVKMDGGLDGYIFENACGVIHEYIKSGGVGNIGGTSLPKVAPKAQ